MALGWVVCGNRLKRERINIPSFLCIENSVYSLCRIQDIANFRFLHINNHRRSVFIPFSWRLSLSIQVPVFPLPLFKEKDNGNFVLNRSAAKEFLEKYKCFPVLFKRCFPTNFFSLTPQDLAGLACEEGFVSRMVEYFPLAEDEKKWKVTWGPFQEEDFDGFPKTNSTLLVHDTERCFLEASQLVRNFSFISNYRLDDVMISYATPGGGVGPHVDNYDVFLIQGRGRRKWSLCLRPLKTEEEERLPTEELRVFSSLPSIDAEHILEPGDMLYLPARYPHWGVSLDEDCMTYSVGLRLPSIADALTWFTEYSLSRYPLSESFLDDTMLSSIVQNDPGLIGEEDIEKFKSIILKRMNELLSDNVHFRSLLGSLLTRPIRVDSMGTVQNKTSPPSNITKEVIDAFLASKIDLTRADGIRLAYMKSTRKSPTILFVEGTEFKLEKGKTFDTFASVLCNVEMPLDCLREFPKSFWKRQSFLAIRILGQLCHFGILRVESHVVKDELFNSYYSFVGGLCLTKIKGYRKPSDSLVQVAYSVFQIHNETGNVWTHLLGGLFFLVLMPYTCHILKQADWTDYVCMLGFIISAAFCFLSSATYHLFICTKRWHYALRHIDHSGIITMISASYLPALNKGFKCFPWYRRIYIGTTISCWLVVIFVVPWLDQRERRTQRNIILLVAATWGIIPLLHFCYYGQHGWQLFLFSTLTMWLIYGLGFIFYLTKWPEVSFTGKFDIWGHSHQWWHLCTIFASFFGGKHF
eukprot:jgi/Galph1/3689/GphlegSOOS_G2366.1